MHAAMAAAGSARKRQKLSVRPLSSVPTFHELTKTTVAVRIAARSALRRTGGDKRACLY